MDETFLGVVSATVEQSGRKANMRNSALEADPRIPSNQKKTIGAPSKKRESQLRFLGSDVFVFCCFLGKKAEHFTMLEQDRLMCFYVIQKQRSTYFETPKK